MSSQGQSPFIHETRIATGGMNVRRGFNRLFLVLSVSWAIYCSVIFPMVQSSEVVSQHHTALQSCYQLKTSMNGILACVKSAEDNQQIGLDRWSFKNFYAGLWRPLLVAAVVLPLTLYGILRGAAAIALWVWRGFNKL